MKKLLYILIMFLLVGCEYDYIHDDPYHPDEYRGVWMLDSISVDGKVQIKKLPDFLQLIQPVMEFNGIGYANWQARKDTIPNVVIGLNKPNVPAIVLDVIQKPEFIKDGIKLHLKQSNTIYYLTNTKR
jgi:hypothetical protein